MSDYIPLVTGGKAPFNDKQTEMARYYHSLGLYFPCTIGAAKVLLFKSGLHLAYDGPATPLKKLVGELAQTIKPKVLITTGTGGGIGKTTALGDLAMGPVVKFDCTTQFKNEPWAKAKYSASPLPAGALKAVTPALLNVNAARLPGAPRPRFGTPKPMRSSRRISLVSTTRPTISACKAWVGFARWATPWSGKLFKRFRPSSGTRFETLPTPKSPIPAET